MHRILLALLIIAFNCTCFARNNNLLDVDFMQSMTDGSSEGEKFLTKNPQYANYLKIFQDNYEAKKPSKMKYSQEPLIPKIMHQIWVGSSIPPLYQNYLDECKKIHPDWKFKIWTDEEVEKLGMEYKDVYDKLRSYAAKADVLRYEILYRFGGVYRDMDTKCYKPLDDLNHLYDAYFGLEGPFYFDYAMVSNNFIGSKPNNDVFKESLTHIKENIDKKLQDFDHNSQHTGVHMFAVENTMLPLTHVLVKRISSLDSTIAFPPSYFMPIRNIGFDLKKYKVTDDLDVKFKSIFSFLKPESMVFHNDAKTEIDNSDFEYDSGLQDKYRSKIFSTLPENQKKIFKIFKRKFDENNPKYLSWSKESLIPQVINFVLLRPEEEVVLNKNLSNWRMLNVCFKLEIWDKNRIVKVFPEMADQINNHDIDDLRFYVGLKILEKFGGTYADFRAKPYKPIFEVSNKYNFYAGMMPISKKSKYILLSKKLIGASAKNPIISKTLALIDLNNQADLKDINKILARISYENIYLGRYTIFPAVNFEPIDIVENETMWRKLKYFVRGEPKAFSDLTEYVVVE